MARTLRDYIPTIPATDECVPFPGKPNSEGYGQIGTTRRGVHENRLAHRVAYEFHVGPIPAGLHLDHLCRNRICVNPKHLEAVTPRENILRGVGATALNARKSICEQGHALGGSNLYTTPDGRRQCRECRRAAHRRWKGNQ